MRLSGELGYPRPQLRREGWRSLDGTWDFAIEEVCKSQLPGDVGWQSEIVVPFSPETPKSGIGNSGFFQTCWYRRQIAPVALAADQRLLLHFCAVDYDTTVWVNGHCVGHHQGGYTPFEFDITEHVESDTPFEIVVRADDDPHDLAKPRGKQDWMLEPHSIWYPRTSGIWQTVWLERVQATRIDRIRWTPNLERWELGLEVHLAGERRTDLSLEVMLHVGNFELARDLYRISGTELARRLALGDPGIDDYRNELLWSPQSPTLIDAQLTLYDASGQVLDRVFSYTALRSVGIQGRSFVLNGRPNPLRLILDQGYWPESGMTPPSDEAIRADIELAKAMGFNGVRKHQKIESPRYLYWADKLGLLVWEEMPSAYRFTELAIERVTREWIDAIQRDYSHPCIIAWVPFNESWGVPNLPDIAAERHFVQSLYHLTKTLDPTRPVIGNDGWESVATDIIGIHDYDDQPGRLRRRYVRAAELQPTFFSRERPGGRLLMLGQDSNTTPPLMLTEFGGIAFTPDSHGWGYTRASNVEQLRNRYQALLDAVRSVQLFAGFCYTQFADTYQEKNGLLFGDRTPKMPLEQIAIATRGPRTARDDETEREWEARMARFRQTAGVTLEDDDNGSEIPSSPEHYSPNDHPSS
ncbi:MAG TPA: glycoside hydrolase family 2 TIM barrel-domain containing protein [Terriglobales bacterium]|nr:glycoside hydrolase family 2 TIM barrel-domain containing protein [Terriglobales bacterium]